ncbi:DUF6622 family protein [Testudinibacter sp. TR-2022]|uniref:DUF6622 family protein n=1 Tax=Testudinibacter sp. TR-2022 TaxID=2585029 RepID=UPI00111B01CC|nr:DUF6622 family protein [Testudinibacter sp. TR-2022]TNH06740.1 hypothetical protein FHQ30_06720 [Pasteurellaceae bacterium Phil11]TNH20577.1 hypothetical protein FHQ29_11985 [Testudinibacter sp. TR-2022]TNH26062.1 hypothetical protein FHQ27_08125 [Testudinibacter sp. TR-2022]
MLTFVQHVPIWVWGLLIFLLVIGWLASQDREMPISRLFILPIAFSIWLLVGSAVTFSGAFKLFFPLLLLGFILGFAWWCKVIPKQYIVRTAQHRIFLAGSYFTLIFALSVFMVKFILTSALAINPTWTNNMSFLLSYALINGFFSGFIWGRTYRLYRRCDPHQKTTL